jgi:hypothetical protein
VSSVALRVLPLLLLGYGLGAAACTKTPSLSAKSTTPTASASSSSSSSADTRVDRIIVTADEIASIASGDSDRGGAMPAVFVLGRSSENARLFLRFPLHLPKTGTIESATLLLSRTDDVDMAPGPVELHAARIVDPWDARSISWPFQPRIEEVRAPRTTILASSARITRIDVRAIVQEWPLRDPKDQGIAVVSDTTNSTGTSFAYMSRDARAPELEIIWAYPDGGPSDRVMPLDRDDPLKKPQLPAKIRSAG